MPRLDGEVFLFGTAISAKPCSCLDHSATTPGRAPAQPTLKSAAVGTSGRTHREAWRYSDLGARCKHGEGLARSRNDKGESDDGNAVAADHIDDRRRDRADRLLAGDAHRRGAACGQGK